MSEEYGSDLITILDEEGNSYVLEHLDTIELNDEMYMAFVPADIDEDDERYGMILLRVVEVDGEEEFEQIEDEEELSRVYDAFMEQLFADDAE